MARQVEQAFDPLVNASVATRNSLGLKIVPVAMLVSEIAVSEVVPRLESDNRSAPGRAATIDMAATVITASIAVFGSLRMGAGAMVKSVIPVIVAMFGRVIGGTVGKAAGVYLSAFACDKLIKQRVAESGVSGIQRLIEVSIVSLCGTGSLQEAMPIRDQFYYDQSLSEMRVVWDKLRATGLGPDAVELTGSEQTPYLITLKDSTVPDSGVVTLPGSFLFSLGSAYGNWIPFKIAGVNVTFTDEREAA